MTGGQSTAPRVAAVRPPNCDRSPSPRLRTYRRPWQVTQRHSTAVGKTSYPGGQKSLRHPSVPVRADLSGLSPEELHTCLDVPQIFRLRWLYASAWLRTLTQCRAGRPFSRPIGRAPHPWSACRVAASGTLQPPVGGLRLWVSIGLLLGDLASAWLRLSPGPDAPIAAAFTPNASTQATVSFSRTNSNSFPRLRTSRRLATALFYGAAVETSLKHPERCLCGSCQYTTTSVVFWPSASVTGRWHSLHCQSVSGLAVSLITTWLRGALGSGRRLRRSDWEGLPSWLQRRKALKVLVAADFLWKWPRPR